MGTGICLFWTGKMGFGFIALGLGFNHWEWDGQFKKWEWDFSSNFNGHIESVIFTTAKFVLPGR